MLKSIRRLYRAAMDNKRFKSLLPQVRRDLIITLIILTGVELLLVARVYPIKSFIDGLTQPPINRGQLGLIIIIIFVLLVVSTLAYHFMDNYRNRFTWRMYLNWLLIGHQKQLDLSADYHTQNSTGEKQSVLDKSVHKIDMLTDELFFATLPSALQIIGITIGLIIIGWQFALLALVTVVSYFVVIYFQEPAMDKRRKAQRMEMKAFERYQSELTANWRTIRQLGLEHQLTEKNNKMLDRFYAKQMNRQMFFRRSWSWQEQVIILSNVAIYGIVVWLILPKASIGSIVLATAWVDILYSHLHRFGDLQRRLTEGLEAVRELGEVLERKPTVTQSDEPVWRNDLKGEIQIKNLHFSYPENRKRALTGVNLTIKPNQTVAIVGPSGGGKSTLASLLMREYDPTEGQILLDDIDLRQLDFDKYRSEMLAVVSQQIQLFDGTIADNLRIVQSSATDADIRQACKKAHAAVFIEELEHGYNTKIGEDGIRLSGGQRQRLAIARALLRKPKILILDEATSALDALSQEMVQNTIDELIAAREATIIVIAHRFSTIENADMVVVMDNGRVTETGTHKQLERKNGLYARLKRLEIGGVLP